MVVWKILVHKIAVGERGARGGGGWRENYLVSRRPNKPFMYLPPHAQSIALTLTQPLHIHHLYIYIYYSSFAYTTIFATLYILLLHIYNLYLSLSLFTNIHPIPNIKSDLSLSLSLPCSRTQHQHIFL